MSDPRIALVAEGPTDLVLIEAALKAILQRSFILTLLQPEQLAPRMGTGWGGVVRWCDSASQRHSGSLDADPTLAIFDLLIIHIDADVALKQYANYGPDLADMAVTKNWPVLPCKQPCPPAVNTCSALRGVLLGWLGNAHPGQKTVCCIPAQSTGAWLVAAKLPASHALCLGLECNAAAEVGLQTLPKTQRVKAKSRSQYLQHASNITSHWGDVKALCSQAAAFEQGVLAVLP